MHAISFLQCVVTVKPPINLNAKIASSGSLVLIILLPHPPCSRVLGLSAISFAPFSSFLRNDKQKF